MTPDELAAPRTYDIATTYSPGRSNRQRYRARVRRVRNQFEHCYPEPIDFYARHRDIAERKAHRWIDAQRRYAAVPDSVQVSETRNV